MAVARLADELLHLILAPSLTISQSRFVSDSPTAFGENDAVSSGSVLLVCKRWLRVATPILYETVIIRSTGQSQALATVFKNNAAFSKHVKKLRLEGAYHRLEEILPRCTNLVTLVLLLHIYSEANVSGLCRSLPLINPVEMILHDEWRKNNQKVRKVFEALCDAIPKWTNLTSFEFPYGGREGHFAILPGSATPRNDRLIDSLAQSKSLRTFYGNLSQFRSGYWLRLARVSSIAFKFRYSPRPLLDLETLEIRAMKETSHLANTSVEFIALLEFPRNRTFMEPKASVEPIVTFKNFSFETIDDRIWSTILTFAALPGHPNPPDTHREAFHHTGAFNSTCKMLSLTCKRFKRLIHPTLFAFPLILSSTSLEKFTKIVLDHQGVGNRVRVITLHLDTFVGQQEIREQLHTLVPHLTGLLSFNCQGPWDQLAIFALTTKLLELLAEASKDTLVTLTGFKLLSPTAPSLAAFAPFKSLRTLHLPSYYGSRRDDYTPVAPDCFTNVHTLRIDGPGLLFDELCKLSLPVLRSVSFQHARQGALEKLFKMSGTTVEELVFSGVADLGFVFSLAPHLLRVDWDPDYQTKDDVTMVHVVFGERAAHQNLEKLTLRYFSRREWGQKEQNVLIDAFFSRLKFSNFPSLKEIHFKAYHWPVDERSISKQVLSKHAVKLRQEHGIEVTDSSGKPWRARA